MQLLNAPSKPSIHRRSDFWSAPCREIVMVSLIVLRSHTGCTVIAPPPTPRPPSLARRRRCCTRTTGVVLPEEVFALVLACGRLLIPVLTLLTCYSSYMHVL